MNISKKIVSLILTTIMLCSACNTSFGATGKEIFLDEPLPAYDETKVGAGIDLSGFNDTKEHWIEHTAMLLKSEGIAEADADGNLNPDSKISRLDFLAMLMAQLNIESAEYNGIFSDVTGGNKNAGFLQKAYELNFIDKHLVSDGKFFPDREISREEASTMLFNCLTYMGVSDKTATTEFDDDYEIDTCFKKMVYSVCGKGAMQGSDDGRFLPRKILSVAEALQIILNVTELISPLAVYVDSEKGNDNASGTKSAPFKTISKATEYVRENNDDLSHNLYVFIKSGEYVLNSPLALTDEDTGSNGYSVVYSSYGDGNAVISGGKKFKGGWQIDDSAKGIYKLKVGSGIKTRQMFVDGMRMQRASTDTGFINDTYMDMSEDGTYGVSYITKDTYFENYRNIEDLEMVYRETWTESRCQVASRQNNTDGTLTLTMDQPGFKLVTKKAHLSVNLPDHFENQYEFIDEEGEWYLGGEYLYYKPYDFVDLDTAEIMLPVSDGLVSVTGTSEKRAEGIAFVNLDFSYSTWLYPESTNGYSDAQGGRVRVGGDFVPQAALWIQYAKNIEVTDCTFSKLGSTALNVTDWVENVKISGNHIYDISGCGMYVGNHGAKSDYVPIPAKGADMPAINILIENNYVHDYGKEYGSSDGIECMAVVSTKVLNNEIHTGRYSGLVVGYGTNQGAVKSAIDLQNNYIHDCLNEHVYDGGSIYVTEQMSTKGVYNNVSGNLCENQRNMSSVLYMDNESSHWKMNGNVVDNRRVSYWHRNRNPEKRIPLWSSCGGTGENSADNNFIISTPGLASNGTHFSQNGTFWDSSVSDLVITYSGNTFINSGEAPSEELIAEIKKNNTMTTDGVTKDLGAVIDDVSDNTFLTNQTSLPEKATDIINKAGLSEEYLKKHPANVQSIDVDIYANPSLAIGETLNLYEELSIKGYNRKSVPADISNEEIYFTTNRPDVIKVEDDGTVTSLSQGVAKVNVLHIVDGVLRKYSVEIISGDTLSSIEFDTEKVALFVGNSFSVGVEAYSVLGEKYDASLISASYSIEDENVAKVTADGVVTAVSQGTTSLSATAVCDGVTKEISVPVVVKNTPDIDNFNLADFHIRDVDEEIMNSANWIMPQLGDEVTRVGETIRVATPRCTATYSKKLTNELLHGKIKVDGSTSWSALGLRACDPYQQYDKVGQEIYRFVFGSKKLYVDKLIDGVYKSTTVSDRSTDCTFNYNEEYEFYVGAVTIGSVVYIIGVIDSESLAEPIVVKAKDAHYTRLKDSGYFQVYSREDHVYISPPEQSAE